VEAVHRRLGDLASRIEIRLLACEREPGPSGFTAIAVASPSVADDVRPLDTVWAGFAALRDGQQPLRVEGRVFRLVCENGSLASVVEDETEPAEASVEDRIERCFDRQRFAAVVATLRQAAQQRVPDPRPMLDEQGYMPHRGLIEERWSKAKDPTLYGLMNAMTSVARDLPDVRERLDLEGTAGILAGLKPPPRSRRPGMALTPALL
jgi:hypothetical protein